MANSVFEYFVPMRDGVKLYISIYKRQTRELCIAFASAFVIVLYLCKYFSLAILVILYH